MSAFPSYDLLHVGLNSLQEIQDMLVDYTLFGGPPEYVIHAIKGNMTAALRKLFDEKSLKLKSINVLCSCIYSDITSNGQIEFTLNNGRVPK
jgi:hypothetical protein